MSTRRELTLGFYGGISRPTLSSFIDRGTVENVCRRGRGRGRRSMLKAVSTNSAWQFRQVSRHIRWHSRTSQSPFPLSFKSLHKIETPKERCTRIWQYDIFFSEIFKHSHQVSKSNNVPKFHELDSRARLSYNTYCCHIFFRIKFFLKLTTQSYKKSFFVYYFDSDKHR